ncbi:hypothetical protein ACA910_010008 [Epithemia clementina (nom. ined.)]
MGFQTDDMRKSHPEATKSECQRFDAVFSRKMASKSLGKYLTWRAEHGFYKKSKNNGFSNDDAAMWEAASSHALTFSTKIWETENECTIDSGIGSCEGKYDEESLPKRNARCLERSQSEEDADLFMERSDAEECLQSLPRFVCMYIDERTGDFVRDLDGHRVLHVTPAQIDPKFEAHVYALAIAVYLDQIFQGDDGYDDHKSNNNDDVQYEQVTVVLDVRPGVGWPNAPASQMVGLIRHVANHLHLLHPNRLNKFVMFPIPRPAIVLWKVAVQPFLNQKQRQVMELVPGSANLLAPTPHDKLAKFISHQSSYRLELHRRAAFRLRDFLQKQESNSRSTWRNRNSDGEAENLQPAKAVHSETSLQDTNRKEA